MSFVFKFLKNSFVTISPSTINFGSEVILNEAWHTVPGNTFLGKTIESILVISIPF